MPDWVWVAITAALLSCCLKLFCCSLKVLFFYILAGWKVSSHLAEVTCIVLCCVLSGEIFCFWFDLRKWKWAFPPFRSPHFASPFVGGIPCESCTIMLGPGKFRPFGPISGDRQVLANSHSAHLVRSRTIINCPSINVSWIKTSNILREEHGAIGC